MGGVRYKGHWKDEKAEGVGTSFFPNGSVWRTGTWSRDQLIEGQEYVEGGATTGSILWREGTWDVHTGQGRGVIWNSMGKPVYHGEWKGDLPHGYGVERLGDGRIVYDGYQVDGRAHGEGKMYRLNRGGRLCYQGSFVDDVGHGQGRLYNRKGILVFEGLFTRGNRTEGVAYSRHGVKVYEGQFHKNVFHGQGTRYLPDGGVYLEGPFHMGVATTNPDWTPLPF